MAVSLPDGPAAPAENDRPRGCRRYYGHPPTGTGAFLRSGDAHRLWDHLSRHHAELIGVTRFLKSDAARDHRGLTSASSLRIRSSGTPKPPLLALTLLALTFYVQLKSFFAQFSVVALQASNPLPRSTARRRARAARSSMSACSSSSTSSAGADCSRPLNTDLTHRAARSTAAPKFVT